MGRTFTYSIPFDLPLAPGQAVWVPFGPRLLQGIVFEVTDQPAVLETRDIAGVIDPTPVLSLAQVELAGWISRRYLSAPFEAASLMLPPGFERRTLTFLSLKPGAKEPSTPTPQQKELLLLLQREGRVELGELKKSLGARRAETLMGQMVRLGLVARSQEMEKSRVGPKVVPYLRLGVTPEQAREAAALLRGRKASRQADLLELLSSGPAEGLPLAEARRQAPVSKPILERLREQGLIRIEEARETRDPMAGRFYRPSTPLTLTPAQQTALGLIEAALNHPQGHHPPTFLLHGVTGSGKTELYLQAVEKTLTLGKRAIVLVPEIALTPQTIQRFSSRFPGQVAVLHSRLSLGEQFDEWQRIRAGEFGVVIGSRGALFAPQPDLGLIVIDEEHEWTYKQHDSPPRYHAREAALELARLVGAVVVLGSATPDVESYHRAQRGEYELLELTERAAPAARLPQVQIVDLRRELREGNRSLFSRALRQAMQEALEAKEQVILFLNRRGSATAVQCRSCGFVLRCRRCEVPLAYHSAPEVLLCHHCNQRSPVPRLCPVCFGPQLRFLGLGTQRAEEETAQAFPQARLLRWDRDVTQKRGSHEEIMERFLSHRADILIGTQMIAKGLDMPSVTLVGVLSADTGLHLPDLRAGERTFQVLTQVAGRAGRGAAGGRVIIQTYTPEHYAILAAAQQDYGAFFKEEIERRRRHDYPPFSRLAHLLYTHTNAARCQQEAERMARLLRQERDARGLTDLTVLGPTPAFAPRERGHYRWQVLVKGGDPPSLLAGIAWPKGWAVDIDPVSLL